MAFQIAQAKTQRGPKPPLHAHTATGQTRPRLPMPHLNKLYRAITSPVGGSIANKIHALTSPAVPCQDPPYPNEPRPNSPHHVTPGWLKYIEKNEKPCQAEPRHNAPRQNAPRRDIPKLTSPELASPILVRRIIAKRATMPCRTAPCRTWPELTPPSPYMLNPSAPRPAKPRYFRAFPFLAAFAAGCAGDSSATRIKMSPGSHSSTPQSRSRTSRRSAATRPCLNLDIVAWFISACLASQ